MNLEVSLLKQTLIADLAKESFKIVSLFDETVCGRIIFERCQKKKTQFLPSLKRQAPNTFQETSTKRLKSSKAKTKSEPVGNNVSGDYAVLSAASSKVDTSNLISIVQNLRTNEKEFRCSFCEYISKIQANTKRHVEMNHLNAAEVFQCKTCGQSIKLKANLKRHYIKTHNMPPEAADAMLK